MLFCDFLFHYSAKYEIAFIRRIRHCHLCERIKSTANTAAFVRVVRVCFHKKLLRDKEKSLHRRTLSNTIDFDDEGAIATFWLSTRPDDKQTLSQACDVSAKKATARAAAEALVSMSGKCFTLLVSWLLVVDL